MSDYYEMKIGDLEDQVKELEGHSKNLKAQVEMLEECVTYCSVAEWDIMGLDMVNKCDETLKKLKQMRGSDVLPR